MNKKNITRILVYSIMLCVFITACKKDVMIADIDSYSKLYIPQAVKGVHTINFDYDEVDADTVFYGAAIGGFTNNEKDIPLTFQVLETRLAEYNEKNNTTYELMPESSYTLVGEKS